jgi:uncharacterized membrane protein
MQLDEMIEKTEREYMQSQLPTDLSQAETMLDKHKRQKTEILQLINFTNEEGENIVKRVRQQVGELGICFDFMIFFFMICFLIIALCYYHQQ